MPTQRHTVPRSNSRGCLSISRSFRTAISTFRDHAYPNETPFRDRTPADACPSHAFYVRRGICSAALKARHTISRARRVPCHTHCASAKGGTSFRIFRASGAGDKCQGTTLVVPQSARKRSFLAAAGPRAAKSNAEPGGSKTGKNPRSISGVAD
jgi:hypothetical protein